MQRLAIIILTCVINLTLVFSQENHHGQIEDYSNSQNGTLDKKSSFNYLEENQQNKKGSHGKPSILNKFRKFI